MKKEFEKLSRIKILASNFIKYEYNLQPDSIKFSQKNNI